MTANFAVERTSASSSASILAWVARLAEAAHLETLAASTGAAKLKMTKEDLAWLLIRFFGILSLCVAFQSVIGVATFVPDVVSLYKDLGGETDRQLYHMGVRNY